MKALYELKEKFEMELEELARKGELGAGDLEPVRGRGEIFGIGGVHPAAGIVVR